MIQTRETFFAIIGTGIGLTIGVLLATGDAKTCPEMARAKERVAAAIDAEIAAASTPEALDASLCDSLIDHAIGEIRRQDAIFTD